MDAFNSQWATVMIPRFAAMPLALDRLLIAHCAWSRLPSPRNYLRYKRSMAVYSSSAISIKAFFRVFVASADTALIRTWLRRLSWGGW